MRDVIDWLRAHGGDSVRELDGEPERITFALPKELRRGIAGAEPCMDDLERLAREVADTSRPAIACWPPPSRAPAAGSPRS